VIRFKDMTDEMLKAIHCGGCGARGSWFNPPDFCFGKPCLQHDFHYWRGANEDDRLQADNAFLRFMRRTIKTKAWWRRPALHMTAWLYYKGVRAGGDDSFHFAKHMKTKADVTMAVNDYHRQERMR